MLEHNSVSYLMKKCGLQKSDQNLAPPVIIQIF